MLPSKHIARQWRPAGRARPSRGATVSVTGVPEEFDPGEMVRRFKERAEAVKRRGLPPVEGPERQQILRQTQLDFQDFAMLGDAAASLEDGILTLRIDLRPRPGE